MNDYKYIIKAEYSDGTSYTEQIPNLDTVHKWIGFILEKPDRIGEPPKITVKPVAPDVYTID